MVAGFSAINSMPLMLPYMAIHIPSAQAAHRSKKSTHDACPVRQVGIKKIVGEFEYHSSPDSEIYKDFSFSNSSHDNRSQENKILETQIWRSRHITN